MDSAGDLLHLLSLNKVLSSHRYLKMLYLDLLSCTLQVSQLDRKGSDNPPKILSEPERSKPKAIGLDILKIANPSYGSSESFYNFRSNQLIWSSSVHAW